VVTNSGGTGVELADLLAAEGLQVPELSGGLQAELAELLPAGGSARNPVDLAPAWSRFATLYPTLVERLARSGEVDLVISVLLQRSAADTQVAEPVYACWVAARAVRAGADVLQEAGSLASTGRSAPPPRPRTAAGHHRRAHGARGGAGLASHRRAREAAGVVRRGLRVAANRRTRRSSALFSTAAASPPTASGSPTC
jgi:acyl-CoA synthetase (NDP forming)